MNLVKNVYELSERFMKDSKHVFLIEAGIENMAKRMIENGKPQYNRSNDKITYKDIVFELVASSVNYCYWYSQHDIRPNGSSSSSMYNILADSFQEYINDEMSFERVIKRFGANLSKERFPLIEERIRHLNQLVENGENFAKVIYLDHNSIDIPLMEMVLSFPGFASDIFLKRASLFFLQLFRRFGWYESDLHSLHVPADYQIPRVLEYYDCIVYEDELDDAIHESIIIVKNSRPECEIRAATILVVKKLCELTKWNVSEVDTYLFMKRDDIEKPFHLTITTDY